MKVEACLLCHRHLAFCMDTDELYCPNCDICPGCGGVHNCMPGCTTLLGEEGRCV